MISAKEARQNVTVHETRTPVKSMDTIDEMIKLSSMLGSGAISIWVMEKDSGKFRSTLRKKGFDVQTTVGSALNNEALMEITWQIAKYMVKDEVRILK